MNEAASVAPAPRRLRDRIASPSSVMIAVTVAMNIIRIGNTMLLTRLLSPSDFGLAGIMFSAFYIIGMITDTGYQAFVVRDDRGDEPHFLDLVWTMHVIRGVGITLFVFAIAWPLAWFTQKPELAPLVMGAAVIFMIDGLVSTAPFSAVRHGAVRRLSLIDLVANIVQVIAGLVAGLILHNAWAIVIAMIVSSIVKTAASYVVFPGARRRFAMDGQIAGQLWRFSRVIAASSAVTLVIAQVDKVVLARLFPLAEFGVYTIAANLATAPVSIAILYVTRIIYPAIARAWRDTPDQARAIIYQCRGTVFMLFLFAGGGLVGGAPILIRLIYDPRYIGAAFYLRVLAVTAAMTMLTRSISEILVAVNDVRASLSMNIARIVWLIGVGTLALWFYGPVGLVVVLGLIELPAYAYGLAMLRRHRLLDPARELVALGVLGAGAAIGFALAAALQMLRPA